MKANICESSKKNLKIVSTKSKIARTLVRRHDTNRPEKREKIVCLPTSALNSRKLIMLSHEFLLPPARSIAANNKPQQTFGWRSCVRTKEVPARLRPGEFAVSFQGEKCPSLGFDVDDHRLILSQLLLAQLGHIKFSFSFDDAAGFWWEISWLAWLVVLLFRCTLVLYQPTDLSVTQTSPSLQFKVKVAWSIDIIASHSIPI